MKKCLDCGRPNEDNAVQCSGCGTDAFDTGAPAKPEAREDENDLVTLISCEKLTDADLVAAKLGGAGIEAFIPDEQLMQMVAFNLNTYGYVRVQVRRKDLVSAREILAHREAAGGQ